MRTCISSFVVVLALVFASAAASMSATQHLRHAKQSLHSAHGTIRFFTHHTKLLYTGPLARRHIAWHAVHRARVVIAKADRERDAALAALRPVAAANYSTASWYGPGFYGHALACGGTLGETTNGVANKSMACGTRLLVCYSGRCVETSVVDRGPYVSGRDFDLTGGLATTLGFSGVGTISWRLL